MTKLRLAPWLGLGLLVIGALCLLPVELLRTRDVEGWMAAELRELARTHLTAQLDFEALHYEFPLGARVEHATLTAADGTTIIEAQSIDLELAGWPSQDEPLAIEGLSIEGATVRLLRGEDGQYVGFSPFLATPPDDASVTASDVFRLERAEVRDAELLVQVAPGMEPMRIDGFSFELELDEGTDEPEPWYHVELDSHRGDMARLEAELDLSLDRWLAEIGTLRLEVEVSPDTLATLPPGLRALADEHEPRGQLTLELSGTYDLADPFASDLGGQLHAEGFGVSIDRFRFDAERADATFALRDGALAVEELDAELLGGRLGGTMTLGPDGDQPTRLRSSLTLSRVDLGQLLAAGETSSELAGRLSASVQLDVGFGPDGTHLDGHGRATVRDGTLVLLPGMRTLAKVARRDLGTSHDGRVRFRVSDRALSVDELVIETPLLAIRGDGTVSWSGGLDLDVAMGPLQKVGGGPLRDAVASVGSTLLSYQVVGTTSQPRVKVRPMSIGS